VDGSSRLGNGVDVVTLEDDLVLLGLGLGDGDALEELDVADALLTKEVAAHTGRREGNVVSTGKGRENRRRRKREGRRKGGQGRTGSRRSSCPQQ
jgi:hypothetical protein